MNSRFVALTTACLGLSLVGCSGSTSATPTAAIAASVAAALPTVSPKYADEPSAGTAAAPCADKTTGHVAVAGRLPKGFPVVAGWTATGAVDQGKTVAVSGVVKGLPAAIADIRDAAFVKIIAAGYKKTGSDQEPGFEADGDFEGPVAGNINVKTLCAGNLVVTYTFNQ